MPGSSAGNSGAALLLASALTKIHPGAGRSPGVVDLPVVRDPLGYPYIPGSMLKGSLRSTLTLRLNKDKDKDKYENLIKCLFGPKTDDENKFAGSLTFHDLYPLLIPAPSSTHGVLYVTTPTLLARAAALAEIAGAGSESLRAMINDKIKGEVESEFSGAIIIGEPGGDTIRIGAFNIKVAKARTVEPSDLEGLSDLLKELNPLYRYVDVRSHVAIVDESIAVHLIESLLVRVTRVKLDPAKKTVQQGHLWTEEYLPWGTLFVGLIVDNGFKGKFKKKNKEEKIIDCSKLIDNPINKLIELIKYIGLNYRGDVYRLVIGGKETVGGGVVSFRVLQGPDSRG